VIALGLALAETAGFLTGALLLVLFRRDPSPEQVRVWVAVVALAGAAGAVLASGQPTGLGVLDTLLRAGAGAGVVLLGAKAGSRPVLVAAVLAVAASFGADVQYLAVLGTGLALAGLLAASPVPAIDAVVSALAVQVALRLGHATPAGVSALLALLVVAPLVVFGLRRLEAPGRRVVARTALGLGAVAMLGAVTGGASAVLARSSLQSGIDVIGGGTAALEGSSTAVRFDAAGRSFQDARSTLEAWWARPASVVPVVSQQWRLLHAVAVSGQELSAAAVRAASEGSVSDLKVIGGRVPLERISTMGPVLDDTVRQLAAANHRLADASSPWLLPPLRSRLDDKRDELTSAESAARGLSRALPELPAILGANEPRRYFLAVQTPAEERATGGFMGSFGEITADKGQLKLEHFGRRGDLNFQLPPGGGLIRGDPEYLIRYARFGPDRDWGSINVSPDFPTVAGVMAEMYPQSGGAPIDGVISVDPAGLAALLKLVGPITVDGWPDPITADNATKVLLYDQYTRFEYFERVDFLGAVAQEAWRRLTSGSLPSPIEFLPALGPAVHAKHLMVSAVRPTEAALLDEAGLAGRMAPVQGDAFAVVTQNAAGNKIDAFLRRQVDYDVSLNPATGRLSATAKIVLHNDAPATGLPDPVIGNLVDLPAGTNRMYMSVYSPWQLAGFTVGGAPVAAESGVELGRNVYSTTVDIGPGGTATVEVRLTGTMTGDHSTYRLDMHRQPTVAPDDVRTSLTVASGWRIGSGGRSWSRRAPFDSDRTVDLKLDKAHLFGL
jgi:uncharacterized protein DUF4012